MQILKKNGAKGSSRRPSQKLSASDRFINAWVSGDDFEFRFQNPMTLEHRFAPPRKWRFDVAWIKQKVAIEINGGIFRRGRHSRGAGQVKDYEKLNEAQRLGWIVLQFGTNQISSKRKINDVLKYVTDVIKARTNPKTPTDSYLVEYFDKLQVPNHRPKPPKPVRRSRP